MKLISGNSNLPLARAMAAFPRSFPDYFRAVIHGGEESGALPAVLPLLLPASPAAPGAVPTLVGGGPAVAAFPSVPASPPLVPLLRPVPPSATATSVPPGA